MAMPNMNWEEARTKTVTAGYPCGQLGPVWKEFKKWAKPTTATAKILLKKQLLELRLRMGEDPEHLINEAISIKQKLKANHQVDMIALVFGRNELTLSTFHQDLLPVGFGLCNRRLLLKSEREGRWGLVIHSIT